MTGLVSVEGLEGLVNQEYAGLTIYHTLACTGQVCSHPRKKDGVGQHDLIHARRDAPIRQ